MVKILLLFFIFSFLFKTDHSFNQDLGRHLKLGQIIVQTLQVPKTNLFSYTNPDFPFINTHWLFEVFVYLWSQTLKLESLLILKIAIFLFSIWLTIKIIPKTNTALLLPIGFIFFHVLRERTELRPEIFSFLFTSCTYYILEKFLKKETKLIFLLPFLQLIWINTHIYFFVGLALQVIFIIHLRLAGAGGKLRLLSLIFVLSVLISFLNPFGLQGFLYPLNVTKNYGYTIVENQTMFLLEKIQFRNPNFLFVKISLGIIAFSLFFSLIRKTLDLKNFLLSLFGVSLALMNVRGFPYLVFLSLPAALQNMRAIKFNKSLTIISIISAFLLIWESFYYLNGDYYRFRDEDNQVSLKLIESVGGAMNFVLSQNLPNPIFNNFDIGSYIIYRGYPKLKVFVDGRPEAYPKEFFLNTYIPAQSDYSRFKDLDKQIGFKTIIFSHTDQTPWGRTFLAEIGKDEDWKIVYIDDFMLVYVKNAYADEKNLKIIDLSKLKVSDFKFSSHRSYLNLSVFLFDTGNHSAGKTFAQSALQVFPQSPAAKSLLGLP